MIDISSVTTVGSALNDVDAVRPFEYAPVPGAAAV